MVGIVTAALWRDASPVRDDPEARLQRQVMRFLQMALPPNAVASHAPGEGKRTLRAQRELRRSGYVAGWPDIEIVWAGPPPRVIFIELKAPKGALSPEQRETHNRLFYCGHEVLVCRSAEGVENALRELGVPLRGRLAA